MKIAVEKDGVIYEGEFNFRCAICKEPMTVTYENREPLFACYPCMNDEWQKGVDYAYHACQ